jgi:hypothetical protein
MNKTFPNASGEGTTLVTHCVLSPYHERLRRNWQARYRRFAKKRNCTIEEARTSIENSLEDAMQESCDSEGRYPADRD